MMWFAPVLLLAPTLFEQSVVRILTRDFPQAQFVLVRVESEQVLGKRWESATIPIPVGSLVKPFTALAFGSGDPGRAKCDPVQCWRLAGHGEVGLVEALAQSCNSYFLQTAAVKVTQGSLASVLNRFDLPSPDDPSSETLIGLGTAWKIAPERLAQAYARLVNASDTGAILQGLRIAGISGTARLLGGTALSKTGTAPCSHQGKAPGDGYVAMLFPPTAPKYVLLVQVHGVSGAEATRTAVKMLHVLRDGK
jgi:cell division protein FtsI/penicillin-binding protein 2